MNDNEYAATKIMGWKDAYSIWRFGWNPGTDRNQLYLVAMKIDMGLIDAINDGEYEFWNLCMTDPTLALAAICTAHREENP